ncbi:MAG: hypothetical protein ACLUEV_03985 [Alistipes sp.]
MKIMKISPKTAIQAVVSGVVIGALLSRDYPKAGLVVSACFIAFYLGLTFRRRMCYLLHFVSAGSRNRFSVSVVYALSDRCVGRRHGL